MADQDKPEPDDIENDSQPPEQPAEGDLGFAEDSWVDPPPESPERPPRSGLDRTFIPRPHDSAASGSSADKEKAAAEDALNAADTWVPDVPAEADGTTDGSTPPEAEPTDQQNRPTLDVGKTWVPSGTPTTPGPPSAADDEADESEQPANGAAENAADDDSDPPADVDVNQTWVPSSTPTVDAADLSPEEPEDVGKTWVPSGTPTVQGNPPASAEDAGNAANDSADDDQDNHDDPFAVDKTWVSSAMPTISDGDVRPSDRTVNAADADLSGEEPDDTDKTWVPTSSPTRHVTGAAADDSDPNRTWVPSDTPTADGSEADAPPEARTVVAGPPPSVPVSGSDSAVMETVEAPLIGNEQTVFSQTMGMRNPGNDEFDDWQSDQDDLKDGDTAVLDLPDGDESSTSRKTQIWSQQSGDGLSSALTIRHAPVAGESLFDNTLNSDKPDYQIIKKLAEGGMGAVYVARQTSLGRELAIKTLKPLRDRDRKTYTAQGRISQVEHQRREMFLSEALVTGNLVHPHIIPIHDLCQTDDGSPFYSMKRVHGTPWNERIGEMTLDENLEVLLKVCDAIAYAHHNGVVNRDLKPENVMLGEFGEVLVLDWGLAVPASSKDKGRFPSPAAPFGAGTPAYMSPELWTGPENHIGVWSDVYLLGATLFEAITGGPPHEFPEPDSNAGNTGLWMTIDKVVRRNSIRETEESGELMDIAMKAMATAPKHRYRTVLQFQTAIKDWQQHEESRRLARRADESLESADHQDRQQDYQSFQTAAALFEEAHLAWPDNDAARTGLRDTRFKYASLARVKGDYDLGLQIAGQEHDGEFQELKQKLQRARLRRNSLKTATVVATLAVCCVGVISFIQRLQIVALVGTKESLEVEVAAAEQSKVDAQTLAKKAKDDAVEAERQVQLKQREVEAKAKEIAEKDEEIESKDALVQQKQQELTTAQEDLADKESELADKVQELMQSDMKIAAAAAELKTALGDVQQAQQEIAASERELTKINLQKEKLNREKLRAGVDLENAKIASSIRNADFPAALRIVEQLLTDFEQSEELQQLPADERQDRIRELKARQQQLQRRATRNDVPVQSQVFSESGQVLVQGDAAGRLTVRRVRSPFDRLPADIVATVDIAGPVSSLQLTADESLVVAATGSDLIFWSLANGQTERVSNGTANVTTLRLRDGVLISADDNGLITGWDAAARKTLWSIRSTSSIRDVEIMPTSGMFVYAGSRGGQSADILAYRLPPSETPSERPQRLGQLRLPRNRNFPPRCVAVSPDESTLLIGNSRNGELICLRRRTPADGDRDQFPFEHAADFAPEETANWLLNRHQRPINDIAFARDGQRVVTASDDRSVCVWELGAGSPELIERLEGHGARVNSAVFVDPAGRFVLSASADRSCRSWDVQQYDEEYKQLKQDFPEAVDSAWRPAPRSDDVTVADSSQDFRSAYFPTRATVTASRQSNEAAASDNPELIVLNADNAQQRGAINSISLSADGQRLVTGADDGSAVIWDTRTGSPIKGVSTRTGDGEEAVAFEEGHDFNVARLRFLPPHGNVLLTTGFDGTLCLWDADTRKRHAGRQELKLPGLGLVNAVAASADGRLVATSAGGASRRTGAAVVWITSSLLADDVPQVLVELTGFHRAEVSALAFSPDSQLIATGGRDGRVAVWRLADATLLSVGQVHAKNTIVSHLQWTADSQLLSAGFDGRLSLLQVTENPSGDRPGRLVESRAFEHDRAPIERVAVAPDGTRFVTISVRTDTTTQKVDYELQLWHVDVPSSSGEIHLAKVRGQSVDRVVAVNWSASGDRLAVVADSHLQILQTDSWRVVSVLDSPGLGISDVVFAPAGGDRPGRENVIATFDGTAAHLWNIKDRTHLVDFRPLFAVQSTAYVAQQNERLLITGDRALRFFQADESRSDFGETLLKIGDPHAGIINHIQFADVADADGHWFATTGADGTVALWQWLGGQQGAQFVRWLQADRTPVVSVAWLAADRMLITERSGRLRLVSVNGPGEDRVCVVDESRELLLSRSRVSTDGRFVAVAGQDAASGESLAWVFALGTEELRLHCRIVGGHEAGGVQDICFLPDSPYLLTGGADGGALLWNWLPRRSSAEPLVAYEAFQFLAEDNSLAHNAPITCVDVASNGTIATASQDGTAIIWTNPFRQAIAVVDDE